MATYKLCSVHTISQIFVPNWNFFQGFIYISAILPEGSAKLRWAGQRSRSAPLCLLKILKRRVRAAHGRARATKTHLCIFIRLFMKLVKKVKMLICCLFAEKAVKKMNLKTCRLMCLCLRRRKTHVFVVYIKTKYACRSLCVPGNESLIVSVHKRNIHTELSVCSKTKTDS
jgi:hypothetical protein